MSRSLQPDRSAGGPVYSYINGESYITSIQLQLHSDIP